MFIDFLDKYFGNKCKIQKYLQLAYFIIYKHN